MVRYGLALLYLMGRPNVRLRDKVLLWLFGTPAAVFLNAVLLVPTRYYALFKLFDNRWQTRELSAAEIARLHSVAQGTDSEVPSVSPLPETSG
jgi:hyaluronan synthase